jgi:dTMP kinase
VSTSFFLDELRQINDNRLMKGRFFVIDGLGGLGKSTQIEMLKKRLGSKAIFTLEPGGTPHADKLRSFVRAVDGPEPAPLMDFFVFWASRADHVAKKIVPALKQGKIVVSDRFDSSTFAMQIRGDQNKDWEKFFWECRKYTLGKTEPDAYIFIDGPVELARSRRGARSKTEDRFDERKDAYQNRIRKGYLEFAKKLGRKAHVVHAAVTPEEVHEKIWKIVSTTIAK